MLEVDRPRSTVVRRLERAITKYIAEWNEHAEPFRWTTPVREIRRKIRRVTEH